MNLAVYRDTVRTVLYAPWLNVGSRGALVSGVYLAERIPGDADVVQMVRDGEVARAEVSSHGAGPS